MLRRTSSTLTDLLFGRLGRFVVRRIQLTREVVHLLMVTLKSVWLEWGKGRTLVGSTINKQIRFTGVDAVPLVTLLAVAVGILVGFVVSAMVNHNVTRQFAPLFQRMFMELLVTTTAPMLITLIVIARSGTAVSTELGTMRIRRELQVYDAIGANVYYVVIWPRMVGMIVSLVCLTIYFNFAVVLVHFFVVGLTANVGTVQSASQVAASASMINLIQSVVKTALIGLGISTIACYFGLSARRSFTEVPQVATRGVVNSIIFSVLANLVIFWAFYQLFGFRFTPNG